MFFNYKSYNELISHARSEYRFKGDGNYYELHHIVPRCMGGKDEKENLVLLTLGEHVEAHYLIALEHKNNKQIYYANIAAAYLIFHNKKYIKIDKKRAIEEWLKNSENEKITEELKKEFIENKPTNKGKKFYFEHFWIQIGNLHPAYVTQRTLEKQLEKGAVLIDKCPICGKPNSRENWCCCEEHKQQFEKERKLKTHELLTAHMKKQWTKNQDKRMASIKKSELLHFSSIKKIWMHKDNISKQIEKDQVEYFLNDGWKKGRGQSLETRWMKKDHCKPFTATNMCWQKYIDEGYEFFSTCPICGKEITDSYCCCEEHKKEYDKETKRLSCLQQSKNIKKWYKQNPELKSKHAVNVANGLQTYFAARPKKKWVNNGIKSIQIFVTDDEKYKQLGYKDGRISSYV